MDESILMIWIALAGAGLFFLLGEIWVEWRAWRHLGDIQRAHERMKRDLNRALTESLERMQQ